jgi:asparagine synthase (glutamine-hydrolysing)
MTRFLGVAGSAISIRLPDVRAAVDAFIGRSTADSRPAAVAGADMCAAAIADDWAGIAATVGTTSVVCIGRPYVAKNGGAGTARSPLSAAFVAARFAEIGARVLDEIHGPFALALFDSSRSRGLVATDRMGVQPVFCAELRPGIAFASAPADVLAMTGAQPSLSRQALFDYLYGHVIPAPHSIFEGVFRLLPGECIEIEGERSSKRRYWQAQFVENQRRGFAELKDRFFDALREGVRHAMQGAKCGAFLSGGTDSSTVAGLMAEVGNEPPLTFSIGFSASGYDEMEYARLASAHFHTRHHEYYVTPHDIVDALPSLAVAHPQPFGNSSALPGYLCARVAREHGVERLLAGDGGDELFGGNARYAKQHVFSLYERLPEALRNNVLEPVCGAIARRGRLPLIGKVTSYVEQASIPMPARLETYNLLLRCGYAEVLDERFLGAIDTAEPARLNEEAYMNPTAGSLINRMLALDFKTTLADSDLPKVVQSCDFAGVGVAFPMLDAAVVDFSLSLQPAMKLKGTQLRYFFKQALRGFLPDATIQKRKHGFGLPFGEWALKDDRLRALTFDTLSTFKRRDLVRSQFIDRLTSTLMQEHPNYYGTMAWILMTLELWLEKHMDRRPTSVAAHVESA